MNDVELIVVKTYTSSLDAEVDRERLAAEGIDAMVQADDCGGMRPHLQLRGVKLLVRAEDEEKARELLGD